MRVLGLFGLVAIIGLLAAGCSTTKVQQQVPQQPRRVATDQVAVYRYGPPTAKVHIVCFYPLNEKHLKIVQYLNSLADKYPGQVDVTAWDFRTDEGGLACEKALGKICGGILINDKSDFKVTVDGKTSAVSTMGGEWVSWTRPEVAAAVAQTVKQVYAGATPPAK